MGMSIGAAVNPRESALPGIAGGLAIGGGIAAATARSLSFPAPVALGAGALVGVPMATIAIMNHRGDANTLLQSAAVGAAPLAMAGGLLGAFGAAFGGGNAMIASGVLFGGIAGAALGAITHAATRPS
jgi:hypothetical protein